MRFFQSAVNLAKPVAALVTATGVGVACVYKVAEENEQELLKQEAKFRAQGVATKRVQVENKYPSVTSYYMTTGRHTEVVPKETPCNVDPVEMKDATSAKFVK